MNGRNQQSSSHDHRNDNNINTNNDQLLLVALGMLAICASGYILVRRLHLRAYQLVEISIYVLCFFAGVWVTMLHLLQREQQRQSRPRPPLHIPELKDRACVEEAFNQDAIVAGYDDQSIPFMWTRESRSMQTLVGGQTGSGKSTFIKSVISQDLHRIFGSEDNPHRAPLLIIEGKGDTRNLDELKPEFLSAGRLHQLRIFDPARPEISAHYNPVYSKDATTHEEFTAAFFDSFLQKKDFFYGHQGTYFSHLSNVLWYTGKVYNISDVLIMALDEEVMREQITEARYEIENLAGATQQQKLNFALSVRNLQLSLEDRERLLKIQGLVNELMTFMGEALSMITGPYDNLVTIEDVVDQELILYACLNTNLNSRAVTALGRMLLQNLQWIVGKRYLKASAERPPLSVLLDEFSPFAYSTFAQVLQTARGSDTAILISLQALAQLLKVDRGFRDDVTSAPNTIMLLRTHDEETVKFFQDASRVTAKKLTLAVRRTGFFGRRYEEVGAGSQTEISGPRVPEEYIKSQPTGQMEVRTTHHRLGAQHLHLHVRRPQEYQLASFAPREYARIVMPNSLTRGANLRFKDWDIAQKNPRISGRGRR